MLPATPLQEKYGPAPFNAEAQGDCILRSSDGVRYKTSKQLLGLISSWFSKKFKLLQGQSASDQLVVVPEHSALLHTILLFLYPATTTTIDTYATAFQVADAFDKYSIDLGYLRPAVAMFLGSRTALGMDAGAHYALAWRLGLKAEAQRASKHLHRMDIEKDGFKTTLQARTRGSEAFIAFLELHLRRGKVMQGLLESMPIELYRCKHHPISTVDHGRLEAFVLSELCNPEPNEFGLLKSLPTLWFLANRAPIFGTMVPVAKVSSEAPSPSAGAVVAFALPHTALTTEEANKALQNLCTYEECSTQLDLRTPAEFYNIIQRAVSAIESFPQVIEW